MKLYGLAMIAIGLALRSWAIWTLRQAGVEIMEIVKPKEYVTTGPYRWIAHPAYLGSLLMIAGVGIVVMGMYGFVLALPAWPFYASRIHAENKLRGQGWL